MKISIKTNHQGLHKGLHKCVVLELEKYQYSKQVLYSYGRKTKDTFNRKQKHEASEPEPLMDFIPKKPFGNVLTASPLNSKYLLLQLTLVVEKKPRHYS